MREHAGVSIGEVAAAIGISGLTVRSWEQGAVLPEGTAGADWARVVTGLGGRAGRAPHW